MVPVHKTVGSYGYRSDYRRMPLDEVFGGLNATLNFIAAGVGKGRRQHPFNLLQRVSNGWLSLRLIR
jgi:hypothetical protein